jgi:transposase
VQLKGLGTQGACILSKELFGWRQFENRTEVGALVGLTPTPYDSGNSSWEQGISKSGSGRIRSLMVQLGVGCAPTLQQDQFKERLRLMFF